MWLAIDTCIVSNLLQPYYKTQFPNFLTEDSVQFSPEIMRLEGEGVKSLSEVTPLSLTGLGNGSSKPSQGFESCWHHPSFLLGSSL